MGKCKICGAECGAFVLCFKCNKLKAEGKIEKCEKCNTYHEAGKPCNCIASQTASATARPAKQPERISPNGICVICGKDAPKGYLCYDCYKRREAEKNDFPGRRTKQEAMDHYFNQRNSLYRVKNPTYIENGAIRLLAIAEEVEGYGDKYLMNRVYSDIKALMEWKNKKSATPAEKTVTAPNGQPIAPEDAEKPAAVLHSFDDIDYRKQWAAEHQCDDGHYVRSYSELLIDNWLYNNGYRHAYEKSVFMESDPDAVVLSDFYLPDGNVYIEFWGLNDDQRYAERKMKKQDMYLENHLNLIDLEETDVKRLNDIMPRKLHPFLKKGD